MRRIFLTGQSQHYVYFSLLTSTQNLIRKLYRAEHIVYRNSNIAENTKSIGGKKTLIKKNVNDHTHNKVWIPS